MRRLGLRVEEDRKFKREEMTSHLFDRGSSPRYEHWVVYMLVTPVARCTFKHVDPVTVAAPLQPSFLSVEYRQRGITDTVWERQASGGKVVG